MPRRSSTSGRLRTLRPSMRMSPESNGIRRLTSFSAVVLPPPDGPTRTQNVPAGISSERSSTAAAPRPAYRLVTRSKTMSAARVVTWRTRGLGVCADEAPGVRYSQTKGGSRMADYQVVTLDEVPDWLGDY